MADPSTPGYATPCGQEPELFLGRGFTGHEHLSWFGLINMNARLYDPVTGRFLSPDPNVQMPDFTQNFNRYSYGLNNPFVYIDENGEFIITTAIVIGAVIGAAFGVYEGYKIAESKGATGWDKAWYMIGGGLIGGAGGALGGWAGAVVGTAAAGAGISGFVAGAYTGGAAGAVTGFVNGFGMSMLENPQNVGGALWQGIYRAGVGGLSGAAIGGLVQGITSTIKGDRFWNGALKIKSDALKVPPSEYNLDPDPNGGNTTLYRGTTGSESYQGTDLYMTDNPKYAASYVKNGGKLVSIKIPNNTIRLMEFNGDLVTKQGYHANFVHYGTYKEYVFSSRVKSGIVIKF